MKKEGKNRKIKMLAYALLAMIAAILGFSTGLFQMEKLASQISVSTAVLLKLVIMVLLVLLIINLVTMVLESVKLKSHRARSMVSLSLSLAKYVAFIVIFCWGLSILGVNIGTIVASVGILALIVGFSAESLIADVVTGTFMLLENQYNVGDIVEVNGFRGTVTSIGIRTTCITDAGDNVKIINNSEMKNILNRSDHLSRAVSDISIPYETDIERLEGELPKLLEEIYNTHKDTMKNAPQYLGVQALEASGILLRFVVEVSEKNIFSATRILNRDLLLGFRKLGVECPFPQLDIHNR
ncbi:MAG: mechanosensitive ion channel family protein [Lachnospiraceae bacterium]